MSLSEILIAQITFFKILFEGENQMQIIAEFTTACGKSSSNI